MRPDCQAVALYIGRLLDITFPHIDIPGVDLPPWVESDLASWLALFAALIAVAVGLWRRKGPSSSMMWGRRWSASLRANDGAECIEIAGRIHIAPSGSSFLIAGIEAKARFDGGRPTDLDEEHHYDLQPERGGAQTLELTFRIRDDALLRSRKVHIEVLVALADGAKKRTKETLAIG